MAVFVGTISDFIPIVVSTDKTYLADTIICLQAVQVEQSAGCSVHTCFADIERIFDAIIYYLLLLQNSVETQTIHAS